MKWTKRADGHRYAEFRGNVLRMRHAPTGYIISRQVITGWQFVAGDVRRAAATRKAMEVLL